MHFSWLFLVVAAAIATPVTAAELAFKGLALGATEADVMAMYPDAECSDLKQSPGGRYCIVDRSVGACVTKKGKCPDAITVAGVRVEWARFRLWGGKLGELWLRVQSRIGPAATQAHFDRIAGAYIDTFGQPTSDTTPPIATRAGVPYTNRIVTWERPDGAITLTRYAGSIDTSSVLYLSSDGAAAMQREAELARRKAASDL